MSVLVLSTTASPLFVAIPSAEVVLIASSATSATIAATLSESSLGLSLVHLAHHQRLQLRLWGFLLGLGFLPAASLKIALPLLTDHSQVGLFAPVRLFVSASAALFIVVVAASASSVRAIVTIVISSVVASVSVASAIASGLPFLLARVLEALSK